MVSLEQEACLVIMLSVGTLFILQLKCNIIILVIYMVRYVSFYLLQNCLIYLRADYVIVLFQC